MRGRVWRLRSGWTAVALLCLGVLLLWAPDLNLPFGNSDDGRIFARAGIQARNFWEIGPSESAFGARTDPFIRAEYDVTPRTEPPLEAVTYAHHPPLKQWLTVASVGVFGDSPAAVRLTDFVLGAATVAFMAALLRAVGMAWGPTLIGLGVMVSSGFFYVYARMGISFSLLLALTAAVARLRRSDTAIESHDEVRSRWAHSEVRSRWALVGVGVLAALTAMHSWIAVASFGLVVPWLFTGTLRQRSRPGERRGSLLGNRGTLRSWLARGWSPGLSAVIVGGLVGGALTAGWLLNATSIAELAERVAFRTGNDVATASERAQFTFGEFLSRQWRNASHELLSAWWLRLLFVPALLAGLIDRRTRGPVVITLAVAASLTFALQQGAWIHRLWNFPWVAPTAIGMAALADAVRRLLAGRAQQLRVPLGLAAAAVMAVTLAFVVAGGTRDFYLDRPAEAGAVLEMAQSSPEVAQAELAWFTDGIWTPRWISYYLDLPVWMLEAPDLGQVAASDVILVRNDRLPDFVPAGALDSAIARGERFSLISGADLAR